MLSQRKKKIHCYWERQWKSRAKKKTWGRNCRNQCSNGPLLSYIWEAVNLSSVLSLYIMKKSLWKSGTRIKEILKKSAELLKLWPGQMRRFAAALEMFLSVCLQQSQTKDSERNRSEGHGCLWREEESVRFSFDWSRWAPELDRESLQRRLRLAEEFLQLFAETWAQCGDVEESLEKNAEGLL